MSMQQLSKGRRWQLLASASVAMCLVAALWVGIDQSATHPALLTLVMGLFSVTAFSLSGAAVTALVGLRPVRALPLAAAPTERCAIVWLICGEPPEPVAARAAQMLAGLDRTGQATDCVVFILSDTQGTDARHRESAAFAPLSGRVVLRHRNRPVGRKTGNLRDWMKMQDASFDTMLVLDADSSFSAARLLRLRGQMQADARIGLIQPAIRLRPGSNRLAALERLSLRLCGPVFAAGLARLSGDAGNFWGHNALIRVHAFAQDAELPVFRGRAPWGGPVLSHDFVEAAFLRRAGWHVHIDPVSRGSFEDAPGSVTSYLQRDRRWAQGNLQHLRLIGARGLHPQSRLHLLGGVQGYLSAPLWLSLILLFGSGAVQVSVMALVPLLGTLALLMVPKLVASQIWKTHSPARRRILRRAVLAELGLSTLFAPLVMIRRTGFVLAILARRDSGWVPSGRIVRRGSVALGRGEAMAGMTVLIMVVIPQATIGTAQDALWSAIAVAPAVMPLLAAPWVMAWFDAPVGQRRRLEPQARASRTAQNPLIILTSSAVEHRLGAGRSGV